MTFVSVISSLDASLSNFVLSSNFCLLDLRQIVQLSTHSLNHLMEKRKGQKFVVTKALTERYRRSSIPSMQRLLNKADRERSEMMKKIENSVPVN